MTIFTAYSSATESNMRSSPKNPTVTSDSYQVTLSVIHRDTFHIIKAEGHYQSGAVSDQQRRVYNNIYEGVVDTLPHDFSDLIIVNSGLEYTVATVCQYMYSTNVIKRDVVATSLFEITFGRPMFLRSICKIG